MVVHAGISRSCGAQVFFNHVAEMEDGKQKTLPVRGKTSSDVFQKVKAMPGVRRVGKVTEISEAAHDALVHGKPHADRPAEPQPARRTSARPPQARPPGTRPPRSSGRNSTRDFRSVRVVHHGRQERPGEQPFRHLQPPPDALGARAPPTKEQSRQARAVVRAREQAAAPHREYRIVKSRRAGGEPYLLQRGNWHLHKGKRIFTR